MTQWPGYLRLRRGFIKPVATWSHSKSFRKVAARSGRQNGVTGQAFVQLEAVLSKLKPLHAVANSNLTRLLPIKRCTRRQLRLRNIVSPRSRFLRSHAPVGPALDACRRSCLHKSGISNKYRSSLVLPDFRVLLFLHVVKRLVTLPSELCYHSQSFAGSTDTQPLFASRRACRVPPLDPAAKVLRLRRPIRSVQIHTPFSLHHLFSPTAAIPG